MEQPYLIQRCSFNNEGAIIYDYMGAAEYENGDQGKSMERIFRQEALYFKEIVINSNNKEISLFLLAGSNFNFEAYEEYITMLIATPGPTVPHLKEPSYIDKKIKGSKMYNKIDFWFDFENDVFISMSPKINEQIIERLRIIRKKWGF